MTLPNGKQPDDPGTDHEDYAPLTFEPSMAGRELIKLGAVTVGEILPQHGRLVRATILFHLPDAPRTMFPSTSMLAARRKAVVLTREWMEAAGVRR